MREAETNQPRQMRLVEQESLQHYDVVAPLVISMHVLGHSDRYSPEQIQNAQERVAFWGALAAAEHVE